MRHLSRPFLTLLIAILFAVASPLALVAQDDSDQEAQNLDIARQAIDELFMEGNAENIADYYADPVRTHSPTSNEFADFSRELWGEIVAGDLTVLANRHVMLEAIAVSDDIVFVHLTELGAFEGPAVTPAFQFVQPTGERTTRRRVLIFRFEDGKIVEQWDYIIWRVFAVDYEIDDLVVGPMPTG